MNDIFGACLLCLSFNLFARFKLSCHFIWDHNHIGLRPVSVLSIFWSPVWFRSDFACLGWAAWAFKACIGLHTHGLNWTAACAPFLTTILYLNTFAFNHSPWRALYLLKRLAWLLWLHVANLGGGGNECHLMNIFVVEYRLHNKSYFLMQNKNTSNIHLGNANKSLPLVGISSNMGSA